MKELNQEAHRLSRSFEALVKAVNNRAATGERPTPTPAPRPGPSVPAPRKPVHIPTARARTASEAVAAVRSAFPKTVTVVPRVRSLTTSIKIPKAPKPPKLRTYPTREGNIKRDSIITPLVGKNHLTLLKYSPDQPRDEKGRWTAGGVAAIGAGLLGAAALGAGAVLLARNPAAMAMAGRNMVAVGGKVKPVGPGAATATTGTAAAAASKPASRATKPFYELGRRQQQRREAAAHARAMQAGATRAQADAMVAQMRAAAMARGANTPAAAATTGQLVPSATRGASLPTTAPTSLTMANQLRYNDIARDFKDVTSRIAAAEAALPAATAKYEAALQASNAAFRTGVGTRASSLELHRSRTALEGLRRDINEHRVRSYSLIDALERLLRTGGR